MNYSALFAAAGEIALLLGIVIVFCPDLICKLRRHPLRFKVVERTVWFTYTEAKCACGHRELKFRSING